MAHQLQGGLLLGDLDVLHELPFGLVARNLHDGDGRDPRQIHVRRAAAPCRVGLHQVALLDQPTLLLAILDVGDLDLLRDARLARNLLDEVVHLLFVGSRQPVVVLLQDGLQLGPDRNDDVVAGLLLLEVDDLLPVLQCADVTFVDGRVVAEALRRVAPHQEDVAGNILVPVFREVERGDGPDLRLRQIDVLHVGRQHAELAALDCPVVVQTLLAGRAHDDLQLLDMAADRIDGVVLGGEPGDEVVVELQVNVGKVELLAFGFAVLVELHDEPLVVLDGRGTVAEFMDVQPGALLHLTREAGDVVAERFAGADAAAGGEAARVMKAVDDLLQPRLRHCVLGILGNLSEDVAAQFGEVLGQLAPLLLGEVIGKGEAALDRLLFIVPGVGEHQILGVGIERGVPIDVESDEYLGQNSLTGCADTVGESCHTVGFYLRDKDRKFVRYLYGIGRIFENFQTSQLMKNGCKILIYR